MPVEAIAPSLMVLAIVVFVVWLKLSELVNDRKKERAHFDHLAKLTCSADKALCAWEHGDKEHAMSLLEGWLTQEYSYELTPQEVLTPWLNLFRDWCIAENQPGRLYTLVQEIDVAGVLVTESNQPRQTVVRETAEDVLLKYRTDV